MGTASQIASSFVSDKVDLICGIATPSAQTAYNAAMDTDISVIYTAVTDPKAAELADDKGNPVGEVTGTSDKLPIEAQLKMIRELLPDAKKIGILYTTSEANSVSAIAEYKEKVKRYLDKDRYDHTIGVMHTAGCLAMRYGANLEQALTAGLLHDCAKCVPADEKIKLCEKNHIEISDAEYKNPGLLHAKLGAFFARKKYEIENEEILRSIESHTTGRPNMSLLDKIIYIADYIDPGRDVAPNLPEVRAFAFVDIDACLYRILEDTLAYLAEKGATLDPATEETFLYYKNLKNSDSEKEEKN